MTRLLQPTASTQPLGARLRALSDSHRRVVNAAYRRDALETECGTIAFDAAHAFVKGAWEMQLESSGCSFELTLGAQVLPASIDAAIQARLAQEWLLVLAQAEFADPLALLERALDRPLHLRSVRPAARSVTTDATVFGVWRCASLPRSPTAFALRTSDGPSAAALTAALESTRSPPGLDRLGACVLTVALRVAAGHATAGQLEQLQVGAGAVLSTEASGAQRLARAELILPGTRPRSRRLVLATGHIRAQKFFPDEVISMDELMRATPADTTTAVAADGIGEVEVEVQCELGRWSMSLNEIASLAPGMVVDLHAPLDALCATLVAGSQVIARGEVVTVGDQVALRVTETFGRVH